MSYYTGIEYLLYSKKDNSKIIQQFELEMQKLGYKVVSCENNPIENYFSLFFSYDDDMLQLHQRIGYNTKIDAKGCVYIYSGKEELSNPFVISETMNPKKRFFQYAWFPGEYFYFMLTLPDDIKSNAFSKKIFDILIGLLL